MRYRPLPNFNQPVSVICLGTANFGSQIDADTSVELLDRFAELGGNFIDTAHVYGAWDTNGVNGGYGNSETVIGKWLRRRNIREQMIIGTKGGHPDFETGHSGLTHGILRQQLQESLERLQTDYIDIYWLHRDDRSIPVEEILGWLQEPVAKGYIRALGSSHWRIDRLTQAQAAAARLGFDGIRLNQIEWSLARRRELVTHNLYGEQLTMDKATQAFHQVHQIPVAAYSSQAEGLFADRYNNYPLSASDFPKPGLTHKFGSALNEANRQIARELAKSKGCSANQVALAWLLHQPFPVYPVVGPRTLAQLTDSMGSAAIELSEQELKRFQT